MNRELLVNPLLFTVGCDILIYNVFLSQIFDCGKQIFKQICFAPNISCIYMLRSNIDPADDSKNVLFEQLKNILFLKRIWTLLFV